MDELHAPPKSYPQTNKKWVRLGFSKQTFKLLTSHDTSSSWSEPVVRYYRLLLKILN